MKKIIQTAKAPSPVGPYNQAIIHNGTMYISGQVAINPANGEVVVDNIENETKMAMENVKAILEEAGLTFDDVVKCSIFVTDMDNYSRINKVYASYFNEETAPARELVQVARLPKDVNIEISAIAAFD